MKEKFLKFMSGYLCVFFIIPVALRAEGSKQLEFFNTVCTSKGKVNKDFLNDKMKNYLSEIEQIFAADIKNYGECQKVEETAPELYKMSYKKGWVEYRCPQMDNLIIGLFVNKANFLEGMDDFDKLNGDFQKIAGDKSLYVINYSKNKTLLSNNSAARLALGSTFKLYILKKLLEGLNKGKFTKATVLPLEEELISYPSGILQDFPAGHQITIDTLAALMISKSDNTATDHLLNYIGRENVESIAPVENRPFLSTKEMFNLKSNLKEQIIKEYIKGTTEQKRKILKEMKFPRLTEANYQSHTKPSYIKEVEWFASTRELCDLIYTMKGSSYLAINNAFIKREEWKWIGYKGGSEAGVLQMTYLLQKRDNAWFCISGTMNDEKNSVNLDEMMNFIVRAANLILKEQKY